MGYLTKEVSAGREGYYTGAVETCGEPAGQWYVRGELAHVLRGEVDADLMEAVYLHRLDPRDAAANSRATWGEAELLGGQGPAKYRTPDGLYASYLEQAPDSGPEERAELRAKAEKNARQAVAFIDATHSVQKSVTLLGVAFERAENEARAAGREDEAREWAEKREHIEEGARAGARAAVDYLAEKAGYSRTGKHGAAAGRWIDAHDLIVAQFLQHDSRNHDPQLHVHQAILNRVQCADGKWRTLDGAAIYAHRGAASAVGERATEAYLAKTLGVTFAQRADAPAREVVGVPKD